MKNLLLAAALLIFILDLNAKIVYTEPVQNAKYVSVNNNVIIGFDEMIESSDINSIFRVTGSLSGNHTGIIKLTPDKKKLIFIPHQPFAYNEQIEVTFHRLKTSSNSNNKLTYTFQTQKSQSKPVDYKTIWKEYGYMPDNNYVNYDSPIFPPLTVSISNNPSPGHLFLAPLGFTPPYTPYLFIANNDATLFYSRGLTTNVFDFSRQKNGLLTYYLSSALKYYAENDLHVIVDSFYCGNGYTTDFHELQILNNGHALLMSYDPQFIDMSMIIPGGDTNARVIGLIIQEIDENKNVVFQWRSWDHFTITDAIYENMLAPDIDCVHGNGIELDNDGNIMISSRHLNEITKISRTTGQIIWRLGGVNNQFNFVNDTIPFHYQHNIRRILNGNITLFDNGNFRTPLFSRAVEYSLDEVNKVATLVWQYRSTPDIYSPFMGSLQRLHNGNSLIGWGGANPSLTEVTPAGNIALQMTLPANVWSYRVLRDEAKLTLNIKLAVEGFYNSQSNSLSIKDTITAYLRNANSPYNIVDSSKAVVDSINMNGNFRFYNVNTGTYYISTKHRNALETWSKAGGESFISGGVYEYDFTNLKSKAFGNNLVLKGSKYCIYSGDINHDAHIDLTDIILISNDAKNFVTGYVNTDTNGDNFSDLTDLLITYNNSTNFVSVVRP